MIPKYDVWVRNGIRRIGVCPRLDCNWLQMMENDLDPAHLQILHQDTTGRKEQVSSSTRGFIDEVAEIEFYEIPYGIMKKRVYKNGEVDEHPHIFPTAHRQTNTTPIKVPIDDTHTMIFFVFLEPTDNDLSIEQEGNGGIEYVEHYIENIELCKNPVNALHPWTKFKMDITLAQDHMVFETPGPIADRERERLATSDRGIVMYRDMLKREIQKVQRGLDPSASSGTRTPR